MRSVEWLRQHNHDVAHLREEGLSQLPDADILAKAKADNRILLTIDLDFGQLLAASGEKTPTVIVFRLTQLK